MIYSDDTIAAIATPAGSGGIGIIRISGPDAVDILIRLSGADGDTFVDRQLVYGTAYSTDGDAVDEVLFVAMRGPRSFTGEDVVEVHGHGGVANMARLLRAVVDRGARHADPGEFTRRAFHNGRLDLSQAEAVLEVIEAGSERALRHAQSQLRGDLRTVVDGFRVRGTALLAEIEACIDFPEEGLEDIESDNIRTVARGLENDLRALASTFEIGRAVRDGLRVALCGQVNAGKSALFNALVGRERAIVSEDPGTTRDFVEFRTVWEGIPILLVDTAGVRDAESGVEKRGIELGRQQVEDADVVVELCAVDGDRLRVWHDAVWVLSKSDLAEGGLPSDAIATSVVTGSGLDALRRGILDRGIPARAEVGDGLVISSERQRRLLVNAADAFGVAGQTALPPEIVAIDIRVGNQELAAFLGEEVGDEVLDELFARFCIGK